jgi:hypothetical protein
MEGGKRLPGGKAIRHLSEGIFNLQPTLLAFLIEESEPVLHRPFQRWGRLRSGAGFSTFRMFGTLV